MIHPSRRGLFAAFAASAASVPLAGLAATPARAATALASADPLPAPVDPLPAPAGLTSAPSSVTLPPLDASYFTSVTLTSPLTTSVLPGSPARTEVTSGGRRVALLTRGARTVLLPGPRRTFAENKRPFVDDFDRTLTGWGSSPGGGSWNTLPSSPASYSVVPGTGLITLTTSGVSRHANLRDDEITDVDVRSEARFDKVPAGDACSYGLTFGYQDSHNNYRARLSFTTSGAVQFRIEKEVGDTVTQLASALTLTTSNPANTKWTIRVRREGSRIRARAWRSDTAQPTTWDFDVKDSEFGKGRVGLRALANSGCTNLPVTLHVSRFEVSAANWHTPPSVTHGDWVRVLPEPFDGTWTAGLEQTIRGWAGSTVPDALAYAAMFLPGAPAVIAGDGPAKGKQVLGESGYGYLNSQGYRMVGADFHEYMNIGWTFPDGAYTGASSRDAGNLDCSGYTRMVYGYHMGVPMAAKADTSGNRIPRQSRDMADHTPGVLIDRTDGTRPPTASLLQPGDLVLFNADSGDDGDQQTGTVDHVGIYLGRDAAGKRRFLSSRKTINGPTMSDMGGSSLLDGTGLYAVSLHSVRRI
ncbi:NlpC/P60 family protein [Streptomyces kebangsaanensis]|uniref:NlpC/P60 family protein n=1 Tax=Streptomyces kebangsaanensis TaxID=864058 RepID=A0ABW6L186_9ACTN